MALRELVTIALSVIACARGTGAGETEGVSAAPTDDDGAAAQTTSQGSGSPSSAAAGGAPASSTVVASSATSGSGGAGGSSSSTSSAGGGAGCDAQTCNACNVCVAGSACANEYTGCVSVFQCGAYGSCVQSCSDPSCLQSCQFFYPLGVQPYEAYAACLCAQCVTTCSGECA
jgi:hypothetical protein